MIKVGINGFGRIGRCALRAALDRTDMQVVAINDPFLTPEYACYLYTYDTVHGKAKYACKAVGDCLVVRGKKIKFFTEKEPEYIGWKSVGAEYIIDATGVFTLTEKAMPHIKAGAKKVVITAPSKDAPTFVCGVNLDMYKKDMKVVNNASCTTNFLAPLTKIIDDVFGVQEGIMTTVHSVTATQLTVDGVSKKDWRGGRAASYNIIPSSTGAAKAIGEVLPHLKGKLTGMSVRVPTINVSMVDVTFKLKTATTFEKICEAIKKASETNMKGIVGYTNEPVVSSDLTDNPNICIFDEKASIMSSPRFVKLIAWYDNEWGYSCKLLDLVAHMYSVDNKIKSQPVVKKTTKSTTKKTVKHMAKK